MRLDIYLKHIQLKQQKKAHETVIQPIGEYVFDKDYDVTPAEDLLRVAELAKGRGYGRRRG